MPPDGCPSRIAVVLNRDRRLNSVRRGLINAWTFGRKKSMPVPRKSAMIAIYANDNLPNGTHVLNTNDGEPGTIMNGFSCDSTTGWYEYEVETRYGIERWLRSDFMLISEIEERTQ
jgi:hypothetical protein